MHSNVLRNGLLSLFLLLSLTACATKTEYRTIKLLPPDSLLADCTETEVPLVVNGDLPRKITALRGDLRACNADKAALRQWKAESK